MAEPGHNSERQDYEDQKFLSAFAKVKRLNTEKAENAAEYKSVYDSLKPFGLTKEDVKWALELQEKDAGQIMETMGRRLRIAKLFGHGVSRQFEMFDEDRVPIEDRAYDEGLAIGKRREQATNPYGIDSAAGQKWQQGVNDGNAWANRDLAAKFEAEDVEDETEIIKAGDDPFPDPEVETSETDKWGEMQAEDDGNVVPLNQAAE